MAAIFKSKTKSSDLLLLLVTNRDSLLLLVSISVFVRRNVWFQLLSEFLNEQLTVFSDLGVLSVVHSTAVDDQFQVWPQLILAPVVSTTNPLKYQIEPHFTRNISSIIRNNAEADSLDEFLTVSDAFGDTCLGHIEKTLEILWIESTWENFLSDVTQGAILLLAWIYDIPEIDPLTFWIILDIYISPVSTLVEKSYCLSLFHHNWLPLALWLKIWFKWSHRDNFDVLPLEELVPQMCFKSLTCKLILLHCICIQLQLVIEHIFVNQILRTITWPHLSHKLGLLVLICKLVKYF